MKATSLLESQHRQVAALIEELERPGADRKALTERLATTILAHMVIEEEIFYPQAEKTHRELTTHGVEDHESEIPVLLRLAATPVHDERFAARLGVLKVLLQHHVNEEEHFLFPAVNRAFPAEKNAHLGQQMKARFDQVTKGGLVGALKLRIEEAERRAPAGITAIGTCLADTAKGAKKEQGQSEKGQSEKGQSQRGQSEKGQSHKASSRKGHAKGQSEKGQSEKGQAEKGRAGKGRSERKRSEGDSCEGEESVDSVDAQEGPDSGGASSERSSSRRGGEEREGREQREGSEGERREEDTHVEAQSKEQEGQETAGHGAEPGSGTS